VQGQHRSGKTISPAPALGAGAAKAERQHFSFIRLEYNFRNVHLQRAR
jgi:hypothetical protein